MFQIMDSKIPGCTTTAGTATTGVFNDVPSIGCLAAIVINIINLAFMFLGAITILMLLWGAIRFVTSSGDPKALQAAQKTMTYAVIGAVVVILTFVIINIITTALGFPSILNSFTLYQKT